MADWLTPDDIGIEWGSGRSTLWFAERVRRIVSIEHDPVWHNKTLELIKEKNISFKVDYRIIALNTKIKNYSENQSYADVVNEFPDEYFDFALLDGKIRHVCFKNVLSKIRIGGIVVLDDSERYVPSDASGTYFEKGNYQTETEWFDLLGRIKNWRTIVSTNGIKKTRLWVKPC
ncbi:MAG: class I SAM-dependent methyltransferase [Thermodesulfobacteriota bacterium]